MVRIIGLTASLAVFWALPMPALAQEEAPRRSGFGNVLDNVDPLLNTYTNMIVRKYNLSPEQDDFTRKVVFESAHRFLKTHEGELRGLIDRLFEVRTGGTMTPEELVEWGRRAMPIYNDAKQIILQTNEQWREILTEEQRKIHDEDVKLMVESFETTENQIERIVTGQMTVEEFANPNFKRDRRRPATPPQAPTQVAEEPPVEAPIVVPELAENATPEQRAGRDRLQAAAQMQRERAERGEISIQPTEEVASAESAEAQEAQPTRARRSNRPAGAAQDAPSGERANNRRNPRNAAKADGDFSSEWEKYVEQFIAKYQLNEEQKQQALAILKDCQEQGQRYIRTKQSSFEELEKQTAALQASTDKNKTRQINELNEQRKKLMEPIDQLFERVLKPRLERLPTRAQRRAAEEAEAAAKKRPAETRKP